MKSNYILLAGMLLAGAAFTACDDDKQLTLDATEVKLMEEIKLEVSDVLPLPVGMDTTITYTCGPETADDLTVVFSSSDESVATVDQNGTVRGIKVGEAIISASNPFGFQINNTQVSFQVKVIPELIKVDKIDIVNTTPVGEDGKIYVTDELQLEASILPEDATYKRMVWSSADESIATVDQDGKVMCVKEGTATIYATSTDRSCVRGAFSFEINKYIAAESVTIKPLDGPVCISYGAFALDVTYNPTDATVGSVDWTSDDESVATVRRGVVTPQGFGTCNITATCLENGATASVQVTVEPGLYIWDADTKWTRWEVTNNDAPDIRGDKYWHVQFKNPGEGKKWRRDIRISCNNKNPFEMRLKSYPVLALRMTKLNGGNATLDCVFDGYGNAGNPNPKNGIDLGDGTQLLIYNLGAAKNYAGVDQALFRIFQIKLADIPWANMTDATAFYDVYWIRTFKSEDDAKAFANEQVSRGE